MTKEQIDWFRKMYKNYESIYQVTTDETQMHQANGILMFIEQIAKQFNFSLD